MTAAKPQPPGGERVDFHDMLKTDWQWTLKERLHKALGRPYLAVQLAQILPADVCVRLADRVEELVGPEIQRRVAAEAEQIHQDIDKATSETLARLAAATDEKRKELSNERFGRASRLH